ncbi:MAG: methionyl-tRNA formyltransferase [Actinobacteria bacterium]|nr:methionyl-tRNA formyltransferase [Actinomycetota bacterium]
MRIGIAATPDVAIPTMDWLLTCQHELVCVFAKPDRPSGRGREIKAGIVAQWAKKHSVNLYQPHSAQDLAPLVRDLDLVITVGYGQLLPQEILTIPRYGFLNLHFSLLPAWRGAAPVQRSILHGDSKTGITVFQLDAGMDTGPIYVQREYEISPRANAGEVFRDLALMGPEAISEAITSITAGDVPKGQSGFGVSRAAKISKDEARIDWNQSAYAIDRHIRAFTPEPGTWTNWRGDFLGISSAQPGPLRKELSRGEISFDDNHVLVGCSEGSTLELVELRPAGKKQLQGRDWFNGARHVSGEGFV